MTVRERIRSAARNVKESVTEDSQAAGERVREAASEADLTDEQKRALRRARQRAAREVGRLGRTGGRLDTKKGSDPAARAGSSTSRTKAMFARAENAATAGAPLDAVLDPGPNAEGVRSFARLDDAPTDTETQPDGDATEGGRPVPEDTDGRGEPDWESNPEDLDTPAEVRESLITAGLDPMDTETEDQAAFGHFRVHVFASEDDLGGRSPAQLEAEHDMVVAAMQDHGVDHHSPMDVQGVDASSRAFAFGDAFGVGMDAESGGDDAWL